MVNYTPNIGGTSKNSEDETHVDEIMLKKFVKFHEDMLIGEAARILIKKNISGAPVVNDSEDVIGFLSEKDCLRLLVEMKYHNSQAGTVGDFMSRSCIEIPSNASIYYAIDLFTKNPFQCYPVVKDKKLVGVVYRHTILEAVCKIQHVTW